VTRLELRVGAATTELGLWTEPSWPAEAWVERVRAMRGRAVVVVDAAVRSLGSTRLGELAGLPFLSPAGGEEAKTWPVVESVLAAAMDAGLGRDGCVVGVGGGAVCDAAAFAASVYQRGVAVELVPTTLLAMVDAAVGGKTAINFRGFKNMVGTFHPARRVDVFLAALASLPERELMSGMAEVLKTALLGDEELLATLERSPEAYLTCDPPTMADAVGRCIALKARVVESDPTETGVRAVLNLGHTFGHALEAVAGPGAITHGHGVAWGTARAMELGVRLGRTPRGYRDRVVSLLRRYGFPLATAALVPAAAAPGGAERILDAMRRDKKRHAGGLRFVLQRGVGETDLVPDVPDREVLAALSEEL